MAVGGLDVAVGVAAGFLIAAILLALRKPRARLVEGSDERVLEYGLGLRVFASVGVGFASFLTAMALWGYFMTSDFGGWTPSLVVTVTGSIWLITGLLAVEVFGAWCRFSPSLIVRRSPWRRKVSTSWEEVQGIAYDAGAEWYVIRTPGGIIRLARYLDGIEEFVELARSRVPPERWGERKRSRSGR